MKIYTKTGDTGQTGLFGGGRISKCHQRIEAYGTVDELNAAIGCLLCEDAPDLINTILRPVQHRLFDVGADLATVNDSQELPTTITARNIATIEEAIDDLESQLSPLKTFIVPGGTRSAALLHTARTICRRAEREIIRLSELPGEAVNTNLIVYLNRLSDYLFVASRFANHRAGREDVAWEKNADC